MFLNMHHEDRHVIWCNMAVRNSGAQYRIQNTVNHKVGEKKRGEARYLFEVIMNREMRIIKWEISRLGNNFYALLNAIYQSRKPLYICLLCCKKIK